MANLARDAFRLFAGATLLSTIGTHAVASAPPPSITRIEQGRVQFAAGNWLAPGDQAGDWTFMGTANALSGETRAVFENFSTMQGGLLLLDASGHAQLHSKSLETTVADPAALYRGHRLQEVLESDHDLLGREILAQPADPSFAAVAGVLAPITKLETYGFVGTPQSSDKIGVTYGGRTANFDPAVYVPSIRAVRDEGRVLNGLVGGWQPVLRFVYPEGPGNWTEMLLFAPMRSELTNPRIQPAWYRICRIEGNRLSWVKYFDSYQPFAPGVSTAGSGDFYRDLVVLCDTWSRALEPGLHVELPDHRLADLARHSLVRAMMTRVDSFPKYGVLDRNYGAAEHDGFQDTFNVDTTAMLEWGLFDRARDYLDNYLTHFVRDDGSLLYRGPEIGQYGRMLTVIAEYANYTGEEALLLKHRKRIDAIVQLLLERRRTAQTLARTDPAYGMIAGWCEADSCLEQDPVRYQQPYFSNSAETVRGLMDLGAVWQTIGSQSGRKELVSRGEELCREADGLRTDLQVALNRSRLTGRGSDCIPAIAGAVAPPHLAAARDHADPQFRAYRAYMELLFSGILKREEVETIVHYREGTRDTILGIPTAYGYNSGELAGFLSYGHAYGLLQHDFIREYLLTLYSLSAHQYTRGTWTAPETRLINPTSTAAPYAVPAQLAVPLLVRWMLAFEEPGREVLWLGKALPREWLEDGKVIAVSNLPTRWGRVSFRFTSHLTDGRIDVALDLPPRPLGHETKLRLRLPGSRQVQSVLVNGQAWTGFNPETQIVVFPSSVTGKISMTALSR